MSNLLCLCCRLLFVRVALTLPIVRRSCAPQLFSRFVLGSPGCCTVAWTNLPPRVLHGRVDDLPDAFLVGKPVAELEKYREDRARHRRVLARGRKPRTSPIFSTASLGPLVLVKRLFRLPHLHVRLVSQLLVRLD
jgi:hypothetical protein